jgi:hypothetical protein
MRQPGCPLKTKKEAEMRKTVLSMMVVVGLLALPMIAKADTFTLNEDALLMLWGVFENPESTGSGSTDLFKLEATSYGTKDPLKYLGTTFQGSVGFVGNILSPTLGDFAQMGIGANFWGASSTGSGAKTAQVIGAALGTGPTNDLSMFDEYALTLYNDNDDVWWVNIFLNTGYTDSPWNEPNNFYQNGWTAVAPGTGVTLSIDLSGVANLNHVTNIGFQVGGNMGKSGTDPSDPDVFHVSVAPVPEPGTLMLLGSGLVGLAVFRKKFRS